MEQRHALESQNLCKIIFWVAVVMWMMLIFHLSAQTATESNSLSRQTIRTGASLVMPEFKKLPPKQQDSLVAQWQHTIRKTAHVVLFCGLGVLCMLATRQHSWPMRKQAAIALGISCGYAVFDEVHQLFVSGRAFMVSDIVLDSVAASVGVLLTGLIYYRMNGNQCDYIGNTEVRCSSLVK